jgi:hypothetical protein
MADRPLVAVDQSLAGGLQDVGRAADRRPAAAAVGRVHPHPDGGPSAPVAVDHPHAVVDQLHLGQLGKVGNKGAAQRRVQGRHRAEALGRGVDHHPTDLNLHARLDLPLPGRPATARHHQGVKEGEGWWVLSQLAAGQQLERGVGVLEGPPLLLHALEPGHQPLARAWGEERQLQLGQLGSHVVGPALV